MSGPRIVTLTNPSFAKLVLSKDDKTVTYDMHSGVAYYWGEPTKAGVIHRTKIPHEELLGLIPGADILYGVPEYEKE